MVEDISCNGLREHYAVSGKKVHISCQKHCFLWQSSDYCNFHVLASEYIVKKHIFMRTVMIVLCDNLGLVTIENILSSADN